MTKRPSPFEPNTCRQSKIHFNNFENDLEALRHVEERTLKKLLNGSKNLHVITLNDGGQSNCENGNSEKRDNLMQTCVTNYFSVSGKKMNGNDRVLVSSLDALSSCFFCEARTDSVHQCVQCSEVYCCACSFVCYESPEEARICLSCS